MTRTPTILLIAFVLGACGQTAEGGTTTVSTTVATTTSTTEAATTTTMAPTTTSTTSLEGNWADQPVIVSGVNGIVLGWSDGTRWVEATENTTVPAGGGENYQTVVLDSVGIATGGPPTGTPDFCSLPTQVELDDADLMAPDSEDLGWSPHGTAVSAPWDMTPNEVVFDRAEGAPHVAAVADLLAQRGIDGESPRIRQVAEADLDDDGEIETLVVADGDDPPVQAHDGYYSLVAHFDSDREMTVVADSPEGTDGLPLSYRIGAIADLNGDGIMEIVLSTLAIESSGTAVYEWTAGEQAFTLRLRGGCGA